MSAAADGRRAGGGKRRTTDGDRPDRLERELRRMALLHRRDLRRRRRKPICGSERLGYCAPTWTTARQSL